MRHVLIGLALVLAAMPAAAQTRDKNMIKCGSEDVKISIPGCTALLQAKPAAPDDWRLAAYIYRGQSYQKKGLEELAFADFNNALALNPDAEGLTGLHAAISLYYYKKNLFAECIASASKVIALRPDMAMGYRLRGSAYEMTEQRDKAIADYRTALKIDPDAENLKAALSRLGVTP
ncbi:MAG: tetratricopeptide repeat protein [Bradyrhizobium sp.]|jgi:tetratricopeptide (TPR) repeat protein